MRTAKHVTKELSKGINPEPNQTGGINPDILDPLTEVLRRGARKMLQLAIEAEVETFMEQYRSPTDEQGRQSIVRNGYLPEREILTGLGTIPVTVPRVRDRRKGVTPPIRFTCLPAGRPRASYPSTSVRPNRWKS